MDMVPEEPVSILTWDGETKDTWIQYEFRRRDKGSVPPEAKASARHQRRSRPLSWRIVQISQPVASGVDCEEGRGEVRDPFNRQGQANNINGREQRTRPLSRPRREGHWRD
ncbi:hypothetical protein Bbelb_368590 [Branchiostoma belcheri]|nr:hypothetical protein Bbelb_368590 [Branchiostoma belcheri]